MMLLDKKHNIYKALLTIILVTLLVIGLYNFIPNSNNESKIIFEGYSNAISMDEDISVAQAEMGSQSGNIEATIRLNYDEDYIDALLRNPKPSIDANSDEVDLYIANHRAKMKNYFSSYNEEITKDWKVDAELTYSNYSPYVFLEYESNILSSDSYAELKDLAEEKTVEKIYIHNRNDLTPQYTIPSAMDSAGVKPDVDSGKLTGSGVTIAILEAASGVVEKNNPNFIGKNLIVRGNLFNQESDHATLVASIAAGQIGIAKNAKILSGYVLTNGSTVIDWFLDNGANIVNCSYGKYSKNILGKYTSDSAYLDYMTRNNWLTFVKSAGNKRDDNPDRFISAPGTGYNVITVGATSSNGWLADYSCYNLNGTAISKPTLVAPGNYTNVPNTYASSDIIGGTSFSAPFVTGCVALLMEYKPILKTTPEVVISALTASANEMGLYDIYSSSGFEKMVGAGFINFNRAKTAVDKYYSFTRSGGAASGNIKDTLIIIKEGQTLQASLAWIVKTNKDNANLGLTDYDLQLLDAKGDILASANSSANNVEMIRYKATKTSIYILRIKQYNTAKYDDWGAMCYNVY